MPAFSLFNIKNDDTRRIVVCLIVLLTIALGFLQFSFRASVIATLISAFGLLGLCLMHYYRESINRHVIQAQDIQDLQFLQSKLNLRKPLPYLTGWSASPALAARLHSLVLNEKPQTILELGSGVSTIVMAYAIEARGHGRLVSIDHDAKYAQKTRNELKRHHLDHLAEVIDAPLVNVEINGKSQKWYDTRAIEQLTEINLLVVDGPPRETNKDARVPAYQFLRSKLKPGSIVVIDDSARSDEKNSVDLWTNDSDVQFNESIPSEKGVCVRVIK